jgi:hypothetical protein
VANHSFRLHDKNDRLFAITIAPFAAMLDRLLRLEELRSASGLQHAVKHSMKKQELEAILGNRREHA